MRVEPGRGRGAMLNVLFIGASTVNFGGAPGPWDHSRRLEKLGGVKASHTCS